MSQTTAGSPCPLCGTIHPGAACPTMIAPLRNVQQIITGEQAALADHETRIAALEQAVREMKVQNVGLECDRCNVMWAGENILDALRLGWTYIGRENIDAWWCPDCAKDKKAGQAVSAQPPADNSGADSVEAVVGPTDKAAACSAPSLPAAVVEARRQVDLRGYCTNVLTEERKASDAAYFQACETVEHWRMKAEAYGGIVHGCEPAFSKAGFPVADGIPKVTITEAVENLSARVIVAEKEAERFKELYSAYREMGSKIAQNLGFDGWECGMAEVASVVEAVKERAESAERERDTMKAWASRLLAALSSIDDSNAHNKASVCDLICEARAAGIKEPSETPEPDEEGP